MVISEIVAGIILGPTVLGNWECMYSFSMPYVCPRSQLASIAGFHVNFFPASSIPLLSAVANFGLILFMFLVGCEVRPPSLDFALTSPVDRHEAPEAASEGLPDYGLHRSVLNCAFGDYPRCTQSADIYVLTASMECFSSCLPCLLFRCCSVPSLHSPKCEPSCMLFAPLQGLFGTLRAPTSDVFECT